MSGKTLKILGNDLYGNVDERMVSVFACFEYKKYMNKYVIFAIKGEYGKNKLYYGSIHFKDNIIVIFNVNANVKQIIDQFIVEYFSNNFSEFALIDMGLITRAQLVSYNEMDFDRLELLDQMAIPVEVVVSEQTSSSGGNKVFLWFLLIILIALAGLIVGLKFFPEYFVIKNKMLSCTYTGVTEITKLDYTCERIVQFNRDDKLKKIVVTETYDFTDQETYDDFKENDKQDKYFDIKGTYKYIDDEMKLKLFYNDTSVIDDYDEMLTYLANEGYSCKEGMYEE